MEPRNRFQGINSASLCSLAGRYDNPIPTRCLAPIDFFKNSSSVVCLKLWIYYSYYMGSLSAPYFPVNGEIKQNKSNLDVPLHLPISQMFFVTCSMSPNYSMSQPFKFNLNRAKRVTLHVLLLVRSRTKHSPH